jgi:predicted PurR-regulated permease PerM
VVNLEARDAVVPRIRPRKWTEGENLSVAKVTPSASGQRALVVLTGTVVGVVVVIALYWAQTILIPVALAVYLAFLLKPLVSAFQRYRLGRILSVLLAVFLVALLLGGIGWVVTRQVTGLVEELPQYTDNIQAKISSLRASGEHSPFGIVQRMAREISRGLESKPASSKGSSPEQPVGDKLAGTKIPALVRPPGVTAQPENSVWLARLPSFFSSLAGLAGGLLLTIVLVIFMLWKREDLRNRLIHMVGPGRLTFTTKAADDAGQRISRYLLMQVIVNGTFGVVLALGLFLMGVKYAFLWGMLAAVLRYIPYVGIWIATVPPIALSLAISEGWLQPLLVIGLFMVIEVVCNGFLEPRLFGHSMGVSEVALLVAAAFWAFLWGPIGLVLSNPLTVCLVVLGKYVPQLQFFNVLLSDEPALEAAVTYYQRLLARDQDEATQLVQTYLRKFPPEQAYDELLVPALTYARRDHELDQLTDQDEQFILRASREIVEDLGENLTAFPAEDGTETPKVDSKAASSRTRLVALPARDEADGLALEMLQQLLDPQKWEFVVATVEMLSSKTLPAALVSLAAEKKPALVCIGSLSPGGLARSRYLCKRLRTRLRKAKIIVGRWGLKDNLEQNREQLREAGADHVETTLLETRNRLVAWLPSLSQEHGETLANGAVKQKERV